MKQTHYEVLGVLPDAPKEVIMAAHIALRQKYNLDDYPEQEQAYAQAQLDKIDVAAQVLSHAKSRADYDAFLASQTQVTAVSKEPKKNKFGFWWLLILAGLLWLCYVLISVGYDFYKVGTTSTVNQDTQIVAPPPKTLEQTAPVQIPIKDNKDQEERMLWEQKLKAKRQAFDESWQQLEPQVQQMLAADQEIWLNHAKSDCQAMANGAAKVRLEELKCLSAKYDSRLQEVENFAKSVFFEPNMIEPEAENSDDIQPSDQ